MQDHILLEHKQLKKELQQEQTHFMICSNLMIEMIKDTSYFCKSLNIQSNDVK